MSNRVEQLESQVAELQAAVDGLTEELVETRERLRQLESAEGVEHTRRAERREVADADADATTDDGGDTVADADADADAEAAPDADDDGSDSDGNDIIVA
jgi:peptidoglycan hydrolase CwlO-like protein